MKSADANLSRDHWTALILGVTFLFSLITRIFPALLVGFPLNDGGMFLVMTRDLRTNGFGLPAFTSYNLADIPFAYPPLGFYISALLSFIGLPDLELLRWLPIMFNLLSILAFFLLARALLRDAARAALAAMIYAMVPGNFGWQIMGGGLTRALGMLFIMLAQYHVFQMLQKPGWRYVCLASLFCSLAVLSHPEVGLATASSCALFWVFFGRNRAGFLKALMVAVGTLVLTAPWWGTVLRVHGFIPFLNVFHSGAYTPNLIKNFVTEIFAFDIWGALFRVLLLCGLVWNISKRRIFLPLWLLLPYLVEPRSAAAYAYFPSAIMAAEALADALPEALVWIRSRRGVEVPELDITQHRRFGLTILGLMFLWFIQGTFYGYPLRNTSLLPPLPQEAMKWANENTPQDGKFIIMTGNGGAMTDPVQEWFPALAQRHSQTTLQGQEWMLGAQFFPRLGQLALLQDCASVPCLEDWSTESGLEYTHVFLERNSKTERLLGSLRQDSRYALLYENKTYFIFER